MNWPAETDPGQCGPGLRSGFFLHRAILAAMACLLVPFAVPSAVGQSENRFQVDPKTGRAVGAKEISPEELKRLSQGHGKTLIIDVREANAFEKETIPGAVHIPLEQLKSRLRGIPKGTILAFT